MESTLSKTTHQIESLNGLRGIAALCVLVFHFAEVLVRYKGELNIVGHGYLAVDFFFCLSGFVIAYSYDHRILNIGARQFFKNRLIRLHPLVVFTTITGLIAYLLNPFQEINLADNWLLISLAFIGSLFLIPTPFVPKTWGALTPFNYVAWSLFFEYVATVFYATVLAKVNKKQLVIMTLCFLVAVIYTASITKWDYNGFNRQHFWPGFVRLAFPFTLGVMLCRFRVSLHNRVGLFIAIVLLVGSLFIPLDRSQWWLDPLIITLLFPVIIALGAGSQVSGTIEKICQFLGRLSYPLYMSHILSTHLLAGYLRHNKNILMTDKILLAAGLIVCNVVVAYLVMIWVDEPIRKWLKATGFKSKSATSCGAFK